MMLGSARYRLPLRFAPVNTARTGTNRAHEQHGTGLQDTAQDVLDA